MTPGFVNYWEHEITKPEGPQYSFAQKMVELPKVVFSRTLNSLDGRNVRVENGDLQLHLEKQGCAMAAARKYAW